MDTLNSKIPYYSSMQKNFSIAFLIIATTFFIFFSFSSFNSSNNSFFSSQQPLRCASRQNQTTLKVEKDELGETLEKASMGNKTLIIAVVNRAYVEGEGVLNMFDIFLEGLWAGEGTRELVNHLMIVAVDQTAYDRCNFRGLICYRLVTDGVDFTGEKVFMSSDFINMMWRRTLFLLEVLKRGYNFIFTDTDVLWLRNPFTILTTNTTQDFDIQFSTDSHNGDSSSIANPINTGFYFVKSNNKTISLFNKWYELKDNSTGFKEQDVLQNLVRKGVSINLGMKVRFLETKFFDGFCQDSSDIRSVITVHANCCRFIRAKETDLVRVLGEWGKFQANRSNLISSNLTSSFRWSPHMECRNSWHKKVGKAR